MSNSSPNQIARLNKLKKLGIFHFTEAIEAGISQSTLSRQVLAGNVQRLAPGYYAHVELELDPQVIEYAVACKRGGEHSMIGGLTALFHYGLISEVPNQIWLVVPYSVRLQDSLYRVIRSKHDPSIGIKKHRLYRIATVERAIVEGFRYASKMGLSLVISATRTALHEGKTNEKKIYEMAINLGLKSSIEKYWEVIAAQ